MNLLLDDFNATLKENRDGLGCYQLEWDHWAFQVITVMLVVKGFAIFLHFHLTMNDF